MVTKVDQSVEISPESVQSQIGNPVRCQFGAQQFGAQQFIEPAQT